MPSPNVLDINDFNFQAEVLESKETFVLDFGAPWCPPCKRLLPVIDRLADECTGRLRVGRLDTEDSPEVTSKFRIRGVPTVVVFRGGREVARHVGLTTREKLLDLVGES